MIALTRRQETMSAWLVVVSYAAIIFYFSSQPAPLSLPLFPGFDKLAHALAFGALGLLLYWAIGCSFQALSVRSNGFLSVVISAMYGISDEIHQTFVPTRHADPFDVLADVAGAALALIAFRLLYSRDGEASCRVRS